MKNIILFLVVVCASGCVSMDVSKIVRELKTDPAAVSVELQLNTPWGTQVTKVQRIGGTNDVRMTREGVIERITPRPPPPTAAPERPAKEQAD